MRVAIIPTVLALLAVGANAANGTAPTTEYAYDGTTTYCYWIQQGLAAANFDYAKVQREGKGAECPVLVTIAQSTKGVVSPGVPVEYAFSATLNLKDNTLGLTEPLMTLADPLTRQPVQIGHANVHLSASSSVCDVFRDGEDRRISNQATANFTDGSASFNQAVTFPKSGNYNVFAHIVLPGKTDGDTYQFVAFTTTTVGSNSSATNSSESIVNSQKPTVPAPSSNSSSAPPKDKSPAATLAPAWTAVVAAVSLAFGRLL